MRTARVQTWNQVNSEIKIHACLWNFARSGGFCLNNYLNWWLQEYKISSNQLNRLGLSRVLHSLVIGA
jgi:hypothetical protein